MYTPRLNGHLLFLLCVSALVVLSALLLSPGEVYAADPTFDDGMDTTREVPENSSMGTSVGTPVAATDADTGDTLDYTLSGTDSASFSIVSTSGQIQTKSGVTYDFEAQEAEGGTSHYSVTVEVRDDSTEMDADDTIAVAINLTNVNEAPTIDTTETTKSVAENSTAVLTFAASDVDASDTKAWSVETADDGSIFDISTSGVLSFKNPPDFEDKKDGNTDNVYEVTVKVADAGDLRDTHDLDVTVTNVDEDGTVTIMGMEKGGQTLTASITDPDGTVSSPTWQWSRGEMATDTFTDISGETATTYRLVAADVGKYVKATVSYTDPENSGKSANKVTGQIAPGNAEPEFPSSETGARDVDENTATNTNIGAEVAANDGDSDTLTYALTGADAASFDMVENSGQIKTKGIIYLCPFRLCINTGSAGDYTCTWTSDL